VPRLNEAGRVFWRDLHVVTAFWVSGLLVFLILTGLPWSLVSGGLIHDAAAHIGQGTPDTGLGWDGGGSHAVKSMPVGQEWSTGHAQELAGSAVSHPAAGVTPLPLSRVLQIARTLPGLRSPFELRLPVDAQGVYSVVALADSDPAATAYVHLDQYTSRVIKDVRWKDFGPLGKAIALGVSLHEGRYFGLPNQLLGLAACLGLILMTGAGVMMWWTRRPVGSLGAPSVPMDYRLAPAVSWLTVLLALLMPLMGASLLVVLLGDWLFRKASLKPGRATQWQANS
jgi:uncharacterized iron-regulated membrane protein